MPQRLAHTLLARYQRALTARRCTMRYFHLIPFGFAAILLAFGVYAFNRETQQVVASATLDEPRDGGMLDPVELSPDDMYTVRLSMGIADGQSSTVWSTVYRADDGTPILEIEDSYWSESGTWHEDGESGTWHEENTVTEFNFRVPEAGAYVVEASVLDGTGRPMKVELRRSEPTTFNSMILVFAGLVFAVFGIIVSVRRKKWLARGMQAMGVGSQVTLEGETWRVAEVWTYRDHYYHSVTAVTFVLRREGTLRARYLSIERWETNSTNSEGDEVTKFHYLALLDQPLTDEEELRDVLEDAHRSSVTFQARPYRFDSDNSGNATRRTTEGVSVEERTEVWRDGDLKPGTRLLLRTVVDDDSEVEMAKIVDFGSVHASKLKRRSHWEIPEGFQTPAEEGTAQASA